MYKKQSLIIPLSYLVIPKNRHTMNVSGTLRYRQFEKSPANPNAAILQRLCWARWKKSALTHTNIPRKSYLWFLSSSVIDCFISGLTMRTNKLFLTSSTQWHSFSLYFVLANISSFTQSVPAQCRMSCMEMWKKVGSCPEDNQ